MKTTLTILALCLTSSAHAEPTFTILKVKPAAQATTGGTGTIERAMPGADVKLPPPPQGPWVAAAPTPRKPIGVNTPFTLGAAPKPTPQIGPSLEQWSIRKRCWPDCSPEDR